MVVEPWEPSDPGLAYDGRYTSNTGGHLRPHSPAADCSNDGPLKVAPRCPDAVPTPFVSLPVLLGRTVCLRLLVRWETCAVFLSA